MECVEELSRATSNWSTGGPCVTVGNWSYQKVMYKITNIDSAWIPALDMVGANVVSVSYLCGFYLLNFPSP